jgi:AmpD protein
MPSAALTLDEQGWLAGQPGVQRLLSPNHDERPPSAAIELLLVHNISLPPGCFGGGEVADLFLNRLDCGAHPYFEGLRGLCVSAHFFVRRDGGVIQFVSTLARAWHAGVSCFEGRERCNDFSVGVELEGTDTQPYEDAQYRTLAALTLALRQRHPSLRAARGHEHVAPARKTDPGPAFDWQRYGPAAGWLPAQLP